MYQKGLFRLRQELEAWEVEELSFCLENLIPLEPNPEWE